MSVVKTIVRFKRSIKRLNRVLDKVELLTPDEVAEIKVMIRRLYTIEGNVIRRTDEEN
jgi:hypothetical protein